MGKFSNYKELHRDRFGLQQKDFVHAENLARRSKFYSWDVQNHTHKDIVQLFVIWSGSGILTTTNGRKELHAPFIVFIPINTLHGFRFKEDSDGDLYSINASFFEKELAQPPLNDHILKNLRHIEFQHSPHWQEIHFLNSRIQTELSDINKNQQALTALLFLILLQLHRSTERTNKTSENLDQYTSQVQHFKRLVRSTIKNVSRVQDYASRMDISHVHLNRICHQVEQKNALQIIHELLIEETKEYLINSNFTIAEIAYLFHFKNPAHFTRLFKKIAGVTPKTFKQNTDH